MSNNYLNLAEEGQNSNGSNHGNPMGLMQPPPNHHGGLFAGDPIAPYPTASPGGTFPGMPMPPYMAGQGYPSSMLTGGFSGPLGTPPIGSTMLGSGAVISSARPICFDFVKRQCRRGDLCKYAHEPNPSHNGGMGGGMGMGGMNAGGGGGGSMKGGMNVGGMGGDPNRPSVCFDFLRGQCQRGVMCRFIHDASMMNVTNPGLFAASGGIPPPPPPNTNNIYSTSLGTPLGPLSTGMPLNQNPNAATTASLIPRDKKLTNVCFDYVRGVCRRGEDCRYSHDSEMIAAAQAKSQSHQHEICLDFSRGRCVRGTLCKYSHDLRLLAQLQSSMVGGMGGGGGGGGVVMGLGGGAQHNLLGTSDPTNDFMLLQQAMHEREMLLAAAVGGSGMMMEADKYRSHSTSAVDTLLAMRRLEASRTSSSSIPDPMQQAMMQQAALARGAVMLSGQGQGSSGSGGGLVPTSMVGSGAGLMAQPSLPLPFGAVATRPLPRTLPSAIDTNKSAVVSAVPEDDESLNALEAEFTEALARVQRLKLLKTRSATEPRMASSIHALEEEEAHVAVGQVVVEDGNLATAMRKSSSVSPSSSVSA